MECAREGSGRDLSLTLAVLLLAVVTLGGVFAVAQAQQADGTMDGVTLTSDAPGALTVSWETPSPAPTDYRLRWAPVESDFVSWKDGNETDRGNAYPAGDATSLTLSGLPEGTEFKLQVRARYHKGEYKKSPWSGPWAEASALVMSQPPDVPDGPRDALVARGVRDASAPAAPNLAATAVTPAGDVLVVWLNPSDNSITGYQVLRGPAAGSLVVIEEDTGSSGTSYTDTAPPAGQTHTYAVKARNAVGLSPLSNTLTATVPAAEELKKRIQLPITRAAEQRCGPRLELRQQTEQHADTNTPNPQASIRVAGAPPVRLYCLSQHVHGIADSHQALCGHDTATTRYHILAVHQCHRNSSRSRKASPASATASRAYPGRRTAPNPRLEPWANCGGWVGGIGQSEWSEPRRFTSSRVSASARGYVA